MDIKEFNLLYAVFFFMPGFICSSVLNGFLPLKQDEKALTTLLRYLSFSIFNYAIWSWLIFLILKNYFSIETTAFFIFLILFLSPIFFGFFLAYIIKKEHFKKILKMFPVMHPIPTAWEYCFFNKPSRWIIITLKNEKIIRGYWGKDSFSSSSQIERDIFIEEQFNDNWSKIDRGAGIYVKCEEISTIEFINKEKEN